jgi:hypothetical protein
VALQEFDSMQVENLITCYTRKEGFETALNTRFVPFLEQLSFLMFTGVLTSVHAQLFTAILRQKVCAAIDGITIARDSARWVLLQEPNAVDAIYSDIAQYYLRLAGRHVIVGGMTQGEMIDMLQNKLNPDGYFLITSGVNEGEWLQKILTALSSTTRKQGETLVLVPGKTLEFANNPQIERILVLYGLLTAFNHLNTR